MNYKKMKVFDCQDMPDDVRKVFFQQEGKGNDCAVESYCYLERKPIHADDRERNYTVNLSEYKGNELIYDKTERGVRYIIERGDDIVSDWLFDNGAKIWEEVIIKYWW